VERLENGFDYKGYKDTYVEALQKIIEGEPVTELAEVKHEVASDNLVALLKQSVEATV